jgi:hypothetical protein
VTEFVFVLFFSAGGAAAAILALRATGGGTAGAPTVRWLAIAFLAVLSANIGLYAWPAIAADPAGAAWRAGIAAVVVLAVAAYLRLLRTARRAAARRDGR